MAGKWLEFGNVLKSKNTQNGVKFYIQLEKGLNVRITGKDYKGNKIDKTLGGGDTLMMETPIEELTRMADVGAIDNDRAQDRIARFEKGGDLEFIKYKIKVPPKKED